MADKDTITKEYMQNKATFADAFNYLLYNGEQVIKPEQLKPLDTIAIALPYGNKDKPVPIQRYRDVLKMVTAMEDANAAYLLLGIENQSEIHYAMPVRNMLYDAIQYVKQVDEISRSHKMSDKTPETRAEFLSGFYKTDKLLPVITLTLYFGADKWNAPRDMHSMLSADVSILKYVDNYHLHLIAPAEIDDTDFKKFHTELSIALKYVKYSKDKKKLREIVNEDTAFKSVSRKTADMINIVTSSDLHYDNGEERVDMCEAIEGIRKDGISEGIEIGEEKGILKALASLVKDNILTLADAAKRANMTVEEFEVKTGLKA